MKLSTTVSSNEVRMLVYFAILAIVFLLCKEGIEMFLSWASSSYNATANPMLGQ